MRIIRDREFKRLLPDVFIVSFILPRNETVVFYAEIDERLYLRGMLPRNMRIEQQRFKAFKRVMFLHALFKQRKELPRMLFAEFKAEPKFRRDIPQCKFPLEIRYGIFNTGNTERNIIGRNSVCQKLLNSERG